MPSVTVKVLLIENELWQAELLRKVLAKSEELFYDLLHYETLESGLERLQQGDIHLILLDLGMEPESEGYATFERVYAVASGIPIIVLSGNDDEALALLTVQNGAQDYLVKGHDDNPHSMLRSMHYALERKRSQQELQRAYAELELRVADRTADLSRINSDLEYEIEVRKRAEQALLESNRKLAETLAELRTTQQQVIMQERLHALGRMASGIAHDFNNTLAPILGFSELLLLRPETLDNREKTRDYLQMIHTAAKDSAKVVGRLREFYRYREQTEANLPVVLNDLVQQVILLTQPKWKDQALAAGVNIKILTDFKNVPTVSGNESELREMLINVVFNAVDAVVDKGGGSITFFTALDGGAVRLQIVDTGVGMSEEVRQRCIEPFFSTKSEHGTGLGLGIVYGIIRRHAGRIEIASQQGIGTTVTIRLPLHKDKTEPEQPAVAVAEKKALRILVVEDEPLVREVISAYLLNDKHEIDTAANGVEGLEKYRNSTFDIVLTDRAMPQMNGDQMAKEIKKINPQQTIILLTGFGDLMTGTGEQPENIDLVVSKPCTMNHIRQAIAKFHKS